MTTRILIVDDHEVVRAGMRMLLASEPGLEIIGECTTGEEALEKSSTLQPDIIIMDVSMPGMNGIEATRRIKEKTPEIAVLALTVHEGSDYFFKMLQAGASGYVPKRVAPEVLLRAIDVVADGHVYLEPSLATNLVEDYLQRVQDGSERVSFDGLTPREREVLTLIAEGMSNHAIADQLTISAKTVERHRENMMRKLKLHSRTELVKYAIRKGLITLDDEG